MEMKIACAGYEIAVDWYESTDHSKVLIVLPGYTSSKTRQKIHAEAMVEATGTNALVVDFSGHGSSPFDIRDTRPAQHFLELIQVYDWIKKHYPLSDISVSGSSYGGFLAAQLTGYRQLKDVVLRAPAIYDPVCFYDTWANRIDNLLEYKKRLLEYRKNSQVLFEHPLLKNASKFTGRVLVVVHGDDEIVPKSTTNAYINAFNADSYIAESFGHTIDGNDPDQTKLQAYQEAISNWLKKDI